MSEENSKRQPDLYWKAFKQVKTASIYMRLYRNRLNRWVKGVEIIRSVASSVAIGGWAIWNRLPFIWASIIVATQVADALKGVFPFAKLHRAASDLTIALDTICIDAEDEWESIYGGELSEDDIRKRRTKLRKLQAAAEKKHFPDGFEPSKHLIALASAESEAYFRITFAEETSHATLAADTHATGIESAKPARTEHFPDVYGQRPDAERDG